MSCLCQTDTESILLVVKARPNVQQARAPRCVAIADGKFALEICVNVAPEDGKANKAIMETLARLFDVRLRDIELKSGATARIKSFRISGDGQALAAKVAEIEGA